VPSAYNAWVARANEEAGAGLGPGALQWYEFAREAPSLATDPLLELKQQLSCSEPARLGLNGRVGVAVGSRGIDRIAEVVAATVGYLRSVGAEPVVIPAMGSHGGATPAGQKQVLEELGVDEKSAGAAIDASMDVQELGRLRGHAVYTASAALACDGVVVVNRVKPHTEFRAPVESGLVKMLAIGLGKEKGASSTHAAGFSAFATLLPEAAAIVLSRVKVLFGVALLEDSWHRLRRAEVVPAEAFLSREKELLVEAWSHFGRLPFARLDVLVLREMGKTISGTGMDPNVTGRFPAPGLSAPTSVQRLVALDLADASAGNAVGVGLADIVTERLRAKVDWQATYANAMAAKSLENAKLPMVAGNDRVALSLALRSLTGRSEEAVPAAVAMANTLEVNHFAVTAPLAGVAKEAGYALIGGPEGAQFADEGDLLQVAGLRFFEPAAR
jgi:hypothetical protein